MRYNKLILPAALALFMLPLAVAGNATAAAGQPNATYHALDWPAPPAPSPNTPGNPDPNYPAPNLPGPPVPSPDTPDNPNPDHPAPNLPAPPVPSPNTPEQPGPKPSGPEPSGAAGCVSEYPE